MCFWHACHRTGSTGYLLSNTVKCRIDLRRCSLKKQVIRVALSSVLAVWFDSSASVAQNPSQEASQSSPTASSSDQKVSKAGSDFVIGSGDILNIFVWKEAEVSKSVP